jgi:CDP-glucose 4,6-dehydratase
LKEVLSYYRQKKVFVTGHTGFKGAWMLACLHRAGAIVKGYALAPEFEGVYDDLKEQIPFESVIADIREKDRLTSEITSFKPDFLFHMAAQPLVRRSYEMPAYTFDVNVTGTANVLEALIPLGKKCTTVVITTDKVYQNKEQLLLYKESDTLGGHDPYSASKACTELVVSAFRSSFFSTGKYPFHQKSLATARAGNVIGGGDWSTDRLLPDIVRALSGRKEIEVRNPNAIRPWQFVLEPVSGYLKLGMLLDGSPAAFSKAYNFGPEPDDHLRVSQLVEAAVDEWGYGSWSDSSKPGQPHEAGLLQLDISEAKTDLNWHPKLSAREAIKWTLNWYKQPKAEKLSYTFQQVDDFFSL